MPSRNTIRIDVDDSYYHVYARGASRQKIYLDDEDYTVFLNLFKRYLSLSPTIDPLGREYKNFHGVVELLSYCLMPNHFHILFYQRDEKAISQLMQSIMVSYTRYFNKKYKRSGSLFESRYKSSRISNYTYLMHISRYIHLNPKQWRQWEWSSLPYYIGVAQADWVQPNRILDLFTSKDKYRAFVADYEDIQRTREAIKSELASD